MTVYAEPRNNFEATVDPAVSDDTTANYASGSIWINQTNGATWVCVDASVGAAVWSAGASSGSALLGVTWKFSTTTTDSDPGSKTFRLNNATQASATFIYVDDIAKSGIDARTVLLALKQNDRVYVQQTDASSRFQLFLLSADAVSATGYVKLPVTSENGGSDLQNNKECVLGFIYTRSGSSSPTGAAGGDLADTYPNPTVAQASKSFGLTGVISPTTIGADQNDYAPTGLSTSAVLRISASTPGFNLTGLTGGADGRLLLVHNVGSFPIVFKDEDAGSTAANRFALTTDMTMTTDSVAILQYDSTSSRWRAVSGGGGGGGPTGAAGGDLSGTYPNPTVKQSSVAFALTGIITPTTIAADQNDYSPTGLSTSNTLRLSASTPGFALTGLAGGATGRLLILQNIGSFPITLNDENAGSTAANRFALQDAVDLTLNPSDGCLLQYDATLTRWQVVGSSTISATTRLRVGPADPTRPIPAGYIAAFRGSGNGNGIYIAAGEAEGDILLHIEDQDGTLTFAEVHADDGQWTLGATYAATLAARGFVHGMDNQWAASGLRQQDFNTQFGGYRVAGALVADNNRGVFAATLAIDGVISPASIGADQNDYAPTGIATASFLRLTASTPGFNITGLTTGSSGRMVLIHNIGSFPITLTNEGAGSTAANRFALRGAASVIVTPNKAVVLHYDATTARWRALGADDPYGTAVNTVCQGNDSRLIGTNNVPNTALAQMAANTVKANATAGTADPADLAIGTNTVLGRVAGNIVAAQVATAQVADDAVTNAKLANVATATIKGRTTGGTGDPEDLTGTQATTLLDAFTTSLKGLAPASGGGTTNFLRADGAWLSPGGSGAPGGVTTQVQYNNAGAFAGTAGLVIDAGGLPTLGELTTTDPAAPTAGSTLFSRFRAGRRMPGARNPNGNAFELQPGLMGRKVAHYVPRGNSTTADSWGFGVTVTGTATARNVATTNLSTSLRRIGFVSSATAENAAGVRNNAGQYWQGNGAELGGFYYQCQFIISQTNATVRWFVGLSSTTGLLASVNPTTLFNLVGFSIDSAQTTIRFINNDGAGTATSADQGANFPATTTTAVYEIRLFCAPNTTEIFWSIERFDSAFFATGSVTTNIPANTTLLSPVVWVNNGSTASAVAIDVIHQYMETDL